MARPRGNRDTFEHTSTRAERLANRLRERLASDISHDPARNSWEIAVWEDLLDGRQSQLGKRGTQRWWDVAIEEVVNFMEKPAYAAPDLPDLRAAIRAYIDTEVDHRTAPPTGSALV